MPAASLRPAVHAPGPRFASALPGRSPGGGLQPRSSTPRAGLRSAAVCRPVIGPGLPDRAGAARRLAWAARGLL